MTSASEVKSASNSENSSRAASVWARPLTWISIVSAAIGSLSFFNDLIPNLIRLSFLFKAITGAYAAARDWLWTQFSWLLSQIQIRLPDLPEFWRDVVAITLLVIAALNFESIRRYGRSLLFDFFRDLTGYIVQAFGGRGNPKRTLFDGAGAVSLGGFLFGFWILGVVTRGVLAANGLELGAVAVPGLPARITEAVQVAFEAVGLGALWLGIAVAFAALSGGEFGRPKGFLGILSLIVVTLIAFIPVVTCLVARALYAGWRAVALAFAVVVLLLGANAVASALIDPLLAHPPQWMCALVNAEPDATPEPRCGLEQQR